MKKWTVMYLAFFAVLMGVVSGARTLSAQGQGPVPGTWQSGIKVQNLTPDYSTVLLEFVDENGNFAPYTGQAGVASYGSVEFYLPGIAELPDGKYSAVVLSDKDVAAIATHTNYDAGIADSYNGMNVGATELFVPYVYRGLNSWRTQITVMNTEPAPDGTPAEIFLTIDGPSLSSPIVYQIPSDPYLPPSTAYTFDTDDAMFSGLGNAFIGSATITSSENVLLAAEVNEIRLDASTHVMTSFRALTAADSGSLIYLPSLYKHFGTTWRSGIQIQNTSDSVQTTVTLTFRADPGILPGQGPWVRSGVVIEPQDAWQFYLPGDMLDTGFPIPDGFKGSATIESSGADVSAMVIHTNYNADVAQGYIGISSGSGALSCPSLYKNFGGGSYLWRSGIKVQNLSTADPVQVTFTFSGDPGIPPGQGPWTLSNVSIEPGAAFEFYLPGTSLNGGQPLPDMFKGSVVVDVVGGTADIAGTVIHTNYGRGVANMYNAVNY